MVDAWDPKAESVGDAIDRLQREIGTLSRAQQDVVCFYAVDCGTDAQVLGLRDWIKTFNESRGEDEPRTLRYLTPTHLYHCAVLQCRLDRLRLLFEEATGEDCATVLVRMRAMPVGCITQEHVDAVKKAPLFRPRHIMSHVVRWWTGLDFLQQWFPEYLDLSNQKKISLDAYNLVFSALKHNSTDILDALEEQIPGEDFFRTEFGEQILPVACEFRHKEGIVRMLEWVPREFKTLRDLRGRTPLDRYVTRRLLVNPVGRPGEERRLEEGWVPDPEVVALLTVYTKAAISS